jgi:hypothetical protein
MKKPSGGKSGLLGNYRNEPPLPIYLPGNISLRNAIFGDAWWPLVAAGGNLQVEEYERTKSI